LPVLSEPSHLLIKAVPGEILPKGDELNFTPGLWGVLFRTLALSEEDALGPDRFSLQASSISNIHEIGYVTTLALFLERSYETMLADREAAIRTQNEPGR